MAVEQQGERLQKVLSSLGVASRRAAEEMITAGRVAVNGQVVTELGTKVDPAKDAIMVDGRMLPRQSEIERVTYILNKPVGVVSTVSDPQGRPTVVGLVPSEPRVYPVGRLDFDSDGLLLLTNDGDLAQRMMHPSHEVEKEYEAWVRGHPTPEQMQKLREGVMLEGETRITAPARVSMVRRSGGEALLRFTIREGRNRQVRRMAEAVGLPVLRLRRTRVGPLVLGPLDPGKSRRLTAEELAALNTALKGASPAPQQSRVRRPAPRPTQTSKPAQEYHGANTTNRRRTDGTRSGVAQPGRNERRPSGPGPHRKPGGQRPERPSRG